MKLADWLKTNNVTQTEFAEKIGVTPGFISQLISGTSKPGPGRIEAIHKETAGAVTATDLLDLPAKVA
jgi:transcriptional regulator with XRE-family HTH domain